MKITIIREGRKEGRKAGFEDYYYYYYYYLGLAYIPSDNLLNRLPKEEYARREREM